MTSAGYEVVLEDPAFVVVSKASGLLTVPGRTPDKQDCLWSRLQAAYSDKEVRLVHRLDRDTSGLILFAFTREAQRVMGQQFERRKVKKDYVARVHGRLKEAEGRVDAPLRKDWSRTDAPVYQVCHEKGKPSLTFYRVEAAGEVCSRVRLQPHTGRSHQLRVHMLSLGHPIWGDPIYGPPASQGDGLHLCAVSLSFAHPLTQTPVMVKNPSIPFSQEVW